jgi:hypothetical protein
MTTFHGKHIEEVGIYRAHDYDVEGAIEDGAVYAFPYTRDDVAVLKDQFDAARIAFACMDAGAALGMAVLIDNDSGCKTCGTELIWVDVPNYNCIEN